MAHGREEEGGTGLDPPCVYECRKHFSNDSGPMISFFVVKQISSSVWWGEKQVAEMLEQLKPLNTINHFTSEVIFITSAINCDSRGCVHT
jgi:hypothetical protein